MKTNYIELHPDRLDLPLAPLAAGKLSSAVATIGGDIPDDISALAVVVEWKDGQTTSRYTAAATNGGGFWSVYFAPAYFPAASEELKYHVVGTDKNDNPRWLGTGNMRIFDNPANGSPIAPDILPRNLYAYNPATGLYHKVIAELNELGEIQLAPEQEGVRTP